jgi:hypothetical protein
VTEKFLGPEMISSYSLSFRGATPFPALVRAISFDSGSLLVADCTCIWRKVWLRRRSEMREVEQVLRKVMLS